MRACGRLPATSSVSSTALRLPQVDQISQTPLEARDDLAQEFETLAGKLSRLKRHAGDVAAWSRKVSTSPVPIGSPTPANTIGMADVTCLSAMTRRLSNR